MTDAMRIASHVIHTKYVPGKSSSIQQRELQHNGNNFAPEAAESVNMRDA